MRKTLIGAVLIKRVIDSDNFDEVVEAKPRKVYIPIMSHPWKKQSFEAFFEKQEHHLEMVS